MSSFKQLSKSDVTVVANQANKQWNLSYCPYPTSSEYLTIYKGTNVTGAFSADNDPVTEGQYERLVYTQINQMFYQVYTASLDTSSLMFNINTYESASQQRPTSSYFIYNDNSRLIQNFPTGANEGIRVLAINQNVFGNKILPGNFQLSSSAYNIKDDSYGNLFDYSSSITHVGNIYYAHGLGIINNQDYQLMFPLPPLAKNNSGSFLTTDIPKVISASLNDDGRSGTINTGSIMLSGSASDLILWSTGSNGTIVLTTTVPGTYSIYYTIGADITGSCPVTLRSNKAKITAVVTEPTTTTTTTTSTTTTTTTPTPTTTTSTTTTTTTPEPTTTTSTTTTTTTPEPTTTTTTTSTTTTTTTPEPTTTTTSTTTTTTTAECPCVEGILVEVSSSGTINYLLCEGGSGSISVPIGPNAVGSGECIQRNSLTGDAVWTINSYGVCCSGSTTTSTTTTTTTPTPTTTTTTSTTTTTTTPEPSTTTTSTTTTTTTPEPTTTTSTTTTTTTPEPTTTTTSTTTTTTTGAPTGTLQVYGNFINLGTELGYYLNGNQFEYIAIGEPSSTCGFLGNITGLNNGDTIDFVTLGGCSLGTSSLDCPNSTDSCFHTFTQTGTGTNTIYITVDGSNCC